MELTLVAGLFTGFSAGMGICWPIARKYYRPVTSVRSTRRRPAAVARRPGQARTAASAKPVVGNGQKIIYWSDRYMLNIDKIDRQHKKLADLINQLYQVIQKGGDPEGLERVLNRLFTYTTRHFDSEEAFMRSIGYPHLSEHQKHHRKLVKDAKELAGELNGPRKTLASIKLMAFLKKWLTNHIMVEDRKYAAHYHQSARATAGMRKAG